MGKWVCEICEFDNENKNECSNCRNPKPLNVKENDDSTLKEISSHKTMADNNNSNECAYSLLSDKGIKRHMDKGTIIIEPFKPENLSTSSYDVTLGPYYYRENDPEFGQGIYNPYCSKMVQKVWGNYHEAEEAGEWSKRTQITLTNISDHEKIIWIRPGETILAHTNEFIGGRETVTTMMKARSSMGRNFIEVCKCAGWGDIGYVNRWTMEITNNSRFYSIPLVVGRRIAQIVFFDSEGTLDGASYEKTGKYQSTNDIEEMKVKWSPDCMLPKMYKDREIAFNKNLNA